LWTEWCLDLAVVASTGEVARANAGRATSSEPIRRFRIRDTNRAPGQKEDKKLIAEVRNTP
jgi:hypothetical protein